MLIFCVVATGFSILYWLCILWWWCWFSHLVVSDSCDPLDCSLSGSSTHGFSRQEYWSGLPSPSPGDLPEPGIEPSSPASPALQADSLPQRRQGSPMGERGQVREYTSVRKDKSQGSGEFRVRRRREDRSRSHIIMALYEPCS